MNITKLKDQISQHRTGISIDVTFQPKACIQNLPEELFEIIAGFLSWRDLDNCFNVCRKWRRILNSDKFWKRCCKYPEKYFKLPSEQGSKTAISRDACKWRRHFLLQKDIWENWNRGRYATESDTFSNYLDFRTPIDSVDEHGNHWLFFYFSNKIAVYNITNKPFLHSEYNTQQHIYDLRPLQDKVLTFQSNYNVEVFQFKHPENQLKLSYRFKFDRSELNEQEVVPDYDYVSDVEYILVDDRFFIGCHENINDIKTACIHIWDINSGVKVGTQSVHQQSFVDFIRSARGSDVTTNFNGVLTLFVGDNSKFLVNLVDDRHELCHISLFSLKEMKFVRVVAQFQSKTAWCLMRGDVAVIFHILQENSSQISVFNIYTGLFAKLHFPFDHNPIINNELRFDCNKIILKVRNNITVLSLIDCAKVKQNSFKIDDFNKKGAILKYFDPKFLLLYDSPVHSTGILSVWDIENGVKLWSLPRLSYLDSYQPILNTFEYPGRLLVFFRDEFRILKFDS